MTAIKLRILYVITWICGLLLTILQFFLMVVIMAAATFFILADAVFVAMNNDSHYPAWPLFKEYVSNHLRAQFNIWRVFI